jgi:hypothetical protein
MSWETEKAAAKDKCDKCIALHVDDHVLLYHSRKQAFAAGALMHAGPHMGALLQDPEENTKAKLSKCGASSVDLFLEATSFCVAPPLYIYIYIYIYIYM